MAKHQRLSGTLFAMLASLSGAVISTAFSTVVQAAPVPEAQRIPVDIRRTTFVVRSIDTSLPFYRDALGLTQVYDQLIGAGTDANGKPTPATIRLVLLRANDDYVGLLGLMERLDTTPPPRRELRKAQAGETIIVINVGDLEQRFPKVAATPGITVAETPHLVQYPAPGGGKIDVMFSSVWDPDGNYIELNHLLGTPAGQAAPAQAAPTASATAATPNRQ
jgi:catechol 2,3-dioxygenase-like lactoylglutathione lyase family enzyme